MARRNTWNGIQDFFDNFNRGYDTVGQAVERFRTNQVANARPEESTGFSEADGEQLRAMANARDENGNPYYTIEDNGAGGLRVRNNFQVDQGAGMVDAAPTELGLGRRVTDFLGERREGSMTPAQVERARMEAFANIRAARDPVGALQMRRQLAQDDRDTQRFTNEQTVFQQQQDDRTDAKDLVKARRSEFNRLKALAEKNPDALAHELGDTFSKDGSGVNAMLVFDPRQNKYIFASKIPGMPTQTLSQAELLNHAMGLWEAGNGDYQAGLNAQLNTVKSMRELAREDKSDARFAATGNADLYWKNRLYQLQAAGLDIQRAHLKIAQEKAEMDAKQPVGTTQGFIAGPNGQLTPAITGLSYSRKSGNYSPIVQEMPEARGFIPAQALQGIDKQAEGMVGMPTGRQDPATGKREVYTPETARAAALQQVVQRYSGQGAAPAVSPDVVAAMRANLRGGPAPAQAAAAPAQAAGRPTGAAGLQLRGVDNFVPAAQMGQEAYASYQPPPGDAQALAAMDRRIAELETISRQRPAYRSQLEALKEERAKMTGIR